MPLFSFLGLTKQGFWDYMIEGRFDDGDELFFEMQLIGDGLELTVDVMLGKILDKCAKKYRGFCQRYSHPNKRSTAQLNPGKRGLVKLSSLYKVATSFKTAFSRR